MGKNEQKYDGSRDECPGSLYAAEAARARKSRPPFKKAACTEERTGTLAARGAAAPRRAQETKGQGKCRPCGQFAQKLLKNT